MTQAQIVTFEFRVIDLNQFTHRDPDNGDADTESPRARLEKALNTFGNEGWNLTDQVRPRIGAPEQAFLILSRPKGLRAVPGGSGLVAAAPPGNIRG